MEIQFGDKVRDRLSGIEGILFARTTYLTGCNHIGIKRIGTKPDGSAHDLHWCDEPVVELVESNYFALDAAKQDTGGPALHNMPM